jgi:hypothetical protein
VAEIDSDYEETEAYAEPSATYFAALDGEELGAELMSRIEAYDSYVERKGLLNAWRSVYHEWHGMSSKGTLAPEVWFEGKKGELACVKANHLRNLGMHLKNMTIQNRPKFDARAMNTDPESVGQTHVASSVLDYYMREQRLEGKLADAVEYALTFGEAFGVLNWDATAGDAVTGADGQPMTPGDVQATIYGPMDAIRDWRRRPQDQKWYIIRDYANKFDLAAQYPELSEKILNYGDDRERRLDMVVDLEGESDDIAIYHLYHAPTPALPQGRYVRFLSAECILHADSFPYVSLNVHRIAPGSIIGTSFGYSGVWDLVALQNVVDAMLTVMLTHYDAFGIQNVIKQSGTEFTPDDTHGMRVWTVPGGTTILPQGVNLTAMPPGIGEFIGMVVSMMETISGVNAVARGNTEAIGKSASGAHLALIQTMAMQFNSGLQQSYAMFVEDVGSGIVNMLKRFADVPRMAMIAGRDNRHYMRAFSSNDLRLVNRVVVDTGNPMRNTHQGRMEIATLLLQSIPPGTLDAGQLVSVVTTGNLDVLLGPKDREHDLIRSESAALSEGPDVTSLQLAMADGSTVDVPHADGVPVLRVDNHDLHIPHHVADLFSSPEARNNPRIVAAGLAHLAEHEHWKAFLAGQAQQQAAATATASAPPGPAQAPAPGGGDGGPAPPSAATATDAAEGSLKGMLPRGPTNPLTGQRVPVAADQMRE